MTLLRNDPTTQLAFSLYENRGVFAVFLGSGLSRSAEIPTGWEITLDLVRRVALAQGVEEQTDWAKWYRDQTEQEPNYSVLLEDIASSPDERRAILHRYIEPTAEDRDEGRKTPTAAHHAIARLVGSGHIRVIITTNFDRLMENALREQGIEPTVISSADSLAGAEPLTHSRCYLLKLHGDYKDARILNTDQELSEYPDGYNRLLDRILDEHGLIISGWSGEWDHALRAAFLRAPNRRYPVYWTVRGELGAGAQELAKHRQAKTISIAGADEFFKTLQQRVETLDKSQQQNPLSMELLVNSTKRYLSKPEYRIQLDELFSQEAERLLAHYESATLSPQGNWSQEEFQSRVRLCESLTEPLARMAGVLGRWGEGNEVALVLDVIRAIYGQAEHHQGGVRGWLQLRSYPAVLIFTAYGLGLTRAARWSTLYTLFSSMIAIEHREPKRTVSTLFLWSWNGGDKELWQHLDGMSKRKTPLSDHLLEVMSEWQRSFVGVVANFELLFERFEAMGSLASFDENEESSLEKALVAPGRDVLAWMPMGRAGWHSSSAQTLAQEFAAEPLATELLKAGFARGSPRYLELFIENFNRYVNRMSW